MRDVVDGAMKKKKMRVEITPQELQKVRDKATKQALYMTNILPLLVLRDEFGFGRVRLERYIDELNERVDAFNKGYISLVDVVETIEKETGLRYEMGQD